MRFACWILKATGTHSEYVIIIAFPLQQRLHERASMLRYTYINTWKRRGRRRRKLLDELKERRGYSHLKEEALDCTVWRAGFGRGFGAVGTDCYMNDE